MIATFLECEVCQERFIIIRDSDGLLPDVKCCNEYPRPEMTVDIENFKDMQNIKKFLK